jgi:hypothetical protein
VRNRDLAQRGDDKNLAVLWMAFCAGPCAWALNQGIGYAVMKPLCAGAANDVVWLIAAVSFAIVIMGTWTGWRWLRVLRTTAIDDGSAGSDRSYFLASLTIAFNALIGVLILAAALPPLFLSPCE